MKIEDADYDSFADDVAVRLPRFIKQVYNSKRLYSRLFRDRQRTSRSTHQKTGMFENSLWSGRSSSLRCRVTSQSNSTSLHRRGPRSNCPRRPKASGTCVDSPEASPAAARDLPVDIPRQREPQQSHWDCFPIGLGCMSRLAPRGARLSIEADGGSVHGPTLWHALTS